MFKNTCPDCNSVFESVSATAIYCSQHCKWRVKARRQYSRHKAVKNRRDAERKREKARPFWNLVCFHCASEIRDPSKARKYCSDLCKETARKERRKKLRKNWAGYELTLSHSSYKARAILHGVKYERVSRAEIFERDSWVCGICLEPVDSSKTWPDPMSPSLDHVVPLSLGGEHVESNVQCSHLRCNLKKGATYDKETERV